MNKIMLDLIEELNQASFLYYNGGNSPLTDQEFDKKLQQLTLWEKETGIIYANSPTQNVGAPALDSIPKLNLGKPMLSLAKVHTLEEIKTFQTQTRSILIGTIKLDGLSVRLWYKNGQLVSAATRGNGYIGSDITNHIRHFTNVPLTILAKGEYIVDGEAIIKLSDFDQLNQNGNYKNPRNLAAGSLALLDMKEVKNRKLSFVLWDVVKDEEDSFLYNSSYERKLELANFFGFETVPYYFSDSSNEEIMAEAKQLGYPCDGVVWKISNIKEWDSLGATSHHYNNAIAWKPKDETEWTKLVDIDWTMGRTGVLTPVAIFEPVELEGTEVERANLHNLSVMEELLGKPYFNQEIEVFKANLIIPQVKSAIKLTSRREDSLQLLFVIPKQCPICGGPLERITEVDSTVLKCQAADCPGKLVNKIDHFCSKKGMDIKGLSKSTLIKLIDWGWVNEFADLYDLYEHRAEWITKPGFGVKSVDNILAAIEQSRYATYPKFLSAIGIPQVGASLVKDIIQYPETCEYEDFRKAVDEHWDFTQIEGIGPEKANSILTFNYSEADKVFHKFINMTYCATSESADTSHLLDGYTIVITGTLDQFKNRTEFINLITSYGGKVTSSVSKNTTLLISNDTESNSSKNKDAKRLGIPIVSEKKFLEEYLTF